MNPYQSHTYGERIADINGELYAEYDPATIAALHQLAQGELTRHGRALELGIGTGRIALLLQQTGVEVYSWTSWPASPACN